ncbi:MAG: sigma-70 family RNA polymerase sigma factor [Phycisphaerales bacterium]|nr:sigma-70 family RNA polymerase sigma factor [Phycisphaerales bacterium]
MDLAELVRSARAGDEDAWRDLVGLYGPRVFALARSRLRDHDAAEEVMQSVFATVAIKLREGRYDEHGKFEPWLFRIAMNRVRDAVRRARRDPTTGSGDGLDQLGGQAAGPDTKASFAQLRDAMERLSKPDREVVELRYHAGLSFRQIADLLGEPIGTLLARHHRALRKLQRMLGTGDESIANELPSPAGGA